MKANKTLDKLKKISEDYFVLNNIRTLLEWDARVNLPTNGVSSREKQIKYINREIKKFLQNKELGDLLKDIDESNLSKWQSKNLKLIRRLKEENEIYPEKLLEEIAAAEMRCESLWREAKKQNKFSIVKDSLKSLCSLVKEKAKIRGDWLGKSRYEALMDIYSPGLKIETTDKLFRELKEKLPVIISKIKNKLKTKFTNSDNILITRERHRQNLINCVNHLEKFQTKKSVEDFDKAAEDLRLATRHLGMIVGKVGVEELLGTIFNDFCIGK